MSNGNASPLRDGSPAYAGTVVVYRIGQLGDTLVALPALHWLRQRYADHRLVLITERQPAAKGWVSAWDVLEPTGWFDDVIFYDVGADKRPRVRSVANMGSRLRALRPEHVYNLVGRESLRASTRDDAFFRWFGRGAKYHRAGVLDRHRRATDGTLARLEPEWRRLCGLVGANTEAVPFAFPLTPAAVEGADAALRRVGIGGRERLVAIGPGSKMEAKRWPRDRFAAVGRELLTAAPNIHLVVLGGGEDRDLGRELCETWGHRSVNLAGELSIYESAAVLRRCELYIGNDTGTMHLAGVVGTRCVALFSARENPGSWEPFGSGHAVLRREVPCAGCMLERCDRQNMCLKLIAPADVVTAAMAMIQQ